MIVAMQADMYCTQDFLKIFAQVTHQMAVYRRLERSWIALRFFESSAWMAGEAPETSTRLTSLQPIFWTDFRDRASWVRFAARAHTMPSASLPAFISLHL